MSGQFGEVGEVAERGGGFGLGDERADEQSIEEAEVVGVLGACEKASTCCSCWRPKAIGIKKVVVMAGVSPVTQGTSIAEDHPDVAFYFARLSHNSYVGKGGTDTGNRLFGTSDRA